MSETQMAEAEKKLQTIEERLISLESSVTKESKGKSSNQSNNSEAVEAALKAYQKQILGKLKQIRESLTAEGGDVQSIKNERDQLAQENKQLKVEVERLNYRVSHLIKALNEEESKNTGK